MKTALVTGGNRGIGLEICKQLSNAGLKVILCTRKLDNEIETIINQFDNVVVKKLDVTDDKSIQDLYIDINENFECLDILINNAGIGELFYFAKPSRLKIARDYLDKKSVLFRKINQLLVSNLRKSGVIKRKSGAADVPVEMFKKIMNTNLYGPLRMIQTFIPLLQKSKEAQIINISSGMGSLNNLSGQYPAYSLSKSALNALTIMFSNELAQSGVCVNAVCPGWVRTDMGGHNAPLSPKEGADTVVWLALDKTKNNGKFFRDRTEVKW